MRKVPRNQPKTPPQTPRLPLSNAVEQAQDQSTDDLPVKLIYVALIGLLFAIGFALYVIYGIAKRHLFAKEIEPVIAILYPNPPSVGQTITCRIRFRRREGKLIPFISSTFQELKGNITLQLKTDDMDQSIAVLQEVSSLNNHIIGKFSLRRAGTYQMHIKYKKWFSLLKSDGTVPHSFDVVPGLPAHKHMDFGTHNPKLLYLTARMTQYFRIFVKDEYANTCRNQDVDLDHLEFQLFQMGNPLSVEHEFCLHEPTKDFSHQRSFVCLDEHGGPISTEKEVCLRMRLEEPGIYICSIKYKNYPIQGPKLVICLLREEANELGCLISQKGLPGTIIYSNQCKVRKVDDEDSRFEGYAGISSSNIAIAQYSLALHLYPAYTFPINAKTRITYHGSIFSQEESEVILVVQDGLRPSIRLEMEPTCARKFLCCFAHTQGYVLPKLGMTFAAKKEALKGKIQKSLFTSWFTFEKVLVVQHGNLIRSSLKEIPKVADDWLLPFGVMYESAKGNKKAPASEWLNQLSEQIFVPNEENGMFHYCPGSMLLHPRSSGFSRQPLEFYKLAGNVLAKAVVESLLRNACTLLSNVRFTRCLLVYILGFPVNYKCLETDEPEYFRKIKQILESDVTDKNLTFTTLSDSSPENSSMNLIRNGSSVAVTNENKEYYLNMLTRHRLVHPVEQELQALRQGFNEVIGIDKLCDFGVRNLESLISGGCTVSLADLKNGSHYRIIKEVDDTPPSPFQKSPPINSKKILNWFWIAAENMSEAEKSNLIFFTTGSFSLPSCGWAALHPPFTISLTGSFNQLPKGNPKAHEIILGDHTSFDNFEKTLLEAITPASDRIILPTNVDQHLANYMLQVYSADDEEMEQDNLVITTPTAQTLEEEGQENSATNMDPFLGWLWEFTNFS